MAIVALEKAGYVSGLVSQNTDGLYTQAGRAAREWQSGVLRVVNTKLTLKHPSTPKLNANVTDAELWMLSFRPTHWAVWSTQVRKGISERL